MLPSRHILLGFLFSTVIYFVFPNVGLTKVFIIFLASFLIDVDHYLYLAWRKKKISLKEVYLWHIKSFHKTKGLSFNERDKIWDCFSFLHGIEFLILLFLATIFIHETFLYILIGVSFHLAVDIIYQTSYMNRVDKLSILHDFLKYKKLKFIDGE
jgi:hypothetical protein